MNYKVTIGILIVCIVAGLLMFTSTKHTETSTLEKTTSNTKILKLAHNLPENSALHEASVLLSKTINEKTQGKIKVDIYPKQQLGNDYQMVEMARNGEIDILVTPTSKMSVAVPSMQYADLPFLFPTREDAYELLDGKPGKMILEKLNDIQLYGVTFWENGFKHFTGNVPLLEPKDFQGKKIRVMKSRIIMEQFKALGAHPVPIDFHATRQALADKVVDGQENPLVAIVNMGFHEVQKNMTISEHAYLPYVVSISQKTLQKLSPEEQELLINTATEITQWEREETQKREKGFLETVKQSGVKINTLTSAQKEQFANKTKYITQMFENNIGTDIISKTQELLYKKYPQKDTVVIGIDADLSGAEGKAGLAIKRGVELALDEINQEEGLLGKKVIAIAKNHKSISTQGIQNIREFTNDKNVKAIIGGKHSAIISSQLKEIQSSKKPFIIPWAATNSIVDNGFDQNYIFRVSANDKFVVKSLLAENLKSNKNPLIIVENSVWGRGALEIFINNSKHKLSTYLLNRGESNYSEIYNKIKIENIDSLILVINAAEAKKLLPGLSANHVNLPIVSHWGVIGGDFYQTNKEYLDKIDFRFIQSFTFKNNDNKIANQLGENYINKYGLRSTESIIAPAAVAQAYDATKILALAIKNANSFDGDKIKAALENIHNYDGALKSYNRPFSKNDHEALSKEDFFFTKFSESGEILPIK